MRRGPFLLALALGALLRVAALPLPGTLDVAVWKIWSFAGASNPPITLYGVGGNPPERRIHHFGKHYTTVDYPPLALYEVTAVGRLYHLLRPEYPDSPLLTAAVKLPSVLAEIGLTWVLYAAVWKLTGREESARWVALACWLNPALILNASVLGYLDPLFILPGVAALVTLPSTPVSAGALAAAAVLTKAQAALSLPAFALRVWQTGGQTSRTILFRVIAGATTATVLAIGPIIAIGAGSNMMMALASLTRHDMLSGYAANLWWIVTYVNRAWNLIPIAGFPEAYLMPVQRILAITTWITMGFPDPRPIALGLVALASAWAIWQARAARDLQAHAILAAFLYHAYFVLAVQVHENHLTMAVPLLALTAALDRRARPLFWVVTAIVALNLNLFYGFGEGIGYAIPRTVTIIDASVLLAAVNVVALVWHARVLKTLCG